MNQYLVDARLVVITDVSKSLVHMGPAMFAHYVTLPIYSR